MACEVFSGGERLNRDVKFGCASDLMSDVLAFSRAGALLLTGLVAVQTIRTAHIAEIDAIVLVRGKKPDDKVIAQASQKGIPLLGTPYSMYEACGILYRHGLASTMECSQSVDPHNQA
ncbi:MAG: DRTGG domain-containing protein [Ignavibacteria bacterium]|nr:DRTGG domain-containing protein [Ignavibacteria bacterium]